VFVNARAPRAVRFTLEGNDATFHLKPYLGPHNRYPYHELAGDLEMALSLGHTVSLLSVPGFLMLSGFPGGKKPWGVTIGFKFKRFATASEALRA
jgi:hypothetical protein